MTAKVLRMYGSSSMVSNTMDKGILPLNNWQGVAMEEAQSVTADKMREHYLVKDVACLHRLPGEMLQDVRSEGRRLGRGLQRRAGL